MKKWIALLLASLLLCSALPAFAAPVVEESEYEGKGIVEVDFRGSVRYKNASVAVYDENGTRYGASVTRKSSGEMHFRVKNFETGMRYSYTVSGVRGSRDKTYSSVNGSFYIPAPRAVRITDVEYDDGYVEIEFNQDVTFKNTKATVKDASGKRLTVKITYKRGDEMRLRVKGIKRNARYTFSISGINGETLTGAFVARDD